jgi:hypothetical protein
MSIYPPADFGTTAPNNSSNTSAAGTTVAVGIVLFTTLLLLMLCDRIVQSRKAILDVEKANQKDKLLDNYNVMNTNTPETDEVADENDINNIGISGIDRPPIEITTSCKDESSGRGGQLTTLKEILLGQSSHKPHDDSTVGSKNPIAEHYDASTILFADLVGFTAWSSTRDPGQVFSFLEILYRSFDKLASRRKVCKVETIRDCYVAITGIPEPQNDHGTCFYF